MFNIVFSVFILFVLSACQSQNEKQSIVTDLDVIDAFTSTAQMESKLADWKVNCVDSQNCPDSVGQLLVTEGRVLTACTATLIGPDTALTNSHCFDRLTERTRELINPETLCQSGTRIVFAKQSPSGAEQLRCKKILTKSHLGVDGIPPSLYPDYAIIQLEKTTTRKFDQVTRMGVENEMNLSIRKVNPVQSGLGELEVKQCQVQFQTLLAPLATSSHYHVHVILGCETRSGNSGSSVIDEGGQIRGILFQGIGKNARAPRTPFEKEIVNRATEEKVSYIANVSCMNYNFPGIEGRDEKRCTQYSIKSSRIVDAVDADDIHNRFSEKILEESKNLSQMDSFGYRMHFNSKNRSYYFAPYCVKISQSAFYRVNYPISINSDTWVWSPSIRVGSKMKADVKVMASSQRTCNITLSYDEFYRKNRGSVRLSGSSCVDSEGQLKEGFDVWDVCKP